LPQVLKLGCEYDCVVLDTAPAVEPVLDKIDPARIFD
jgi:hypothetical protein